MLSTNQTEKRSQNHFSLLKILEASLRALFVQIIFIDIYYKKNLKLRYFTTRISKHALIGSDVIIYLVAPGKRHCVLARE